MSREAVQLLAACGPGCRSRQHGRELNAAVIRGSSQQAIKFLSLCSSWHTARDQLGRTPLHVAASVGRVEVLDWLLSAAKLDPNVKDAESGWTALHRAAFYGELAAMRRILQHPRVNIHSVDKEGCSAFDLLQRDLPCYVSYSGTADGDVFSWGDNVNFVHGQEAEKRTPELVDFFAQRHLGVRKVLFSKFHTLFLASGGLVFACGHGLGGRLGTGQEETLLSVGAVPLPHVVADLALGDDHTALLTESGTLLTCGRNRYGQLGHGGVGADASGRCLEPRPVKLRTGKGCAEERVVCVAAGKYHTVIGTATGVATCGLNAGQLGHSRGESLQARPRVVPGLNSSQTAPVMLAASVGATAVYTKNGDLYVLHKYDVKKVVRWLHVRQMSISGGHLDPAVLSSPGTGDPLVLAVISGDCSLALWQAALPGGLRRVRWSGPTRVIDPVHAALSPSTLGLVTAAGEAFLASLTSMRQPQTSKSAPAGARDLQPLGEREEVVEMSARRVHNVYRAVYLSLDRKARDFAVVQAPPTACMRSVPEVERSSMDEEMARLMEGGELHDLLVKIGPVEAPCHKAVLAARSDLLHALFTAPDAAYPDFLHYEPDGPSPVLTVDCPGLAALPAECLLEFCYRGHCRLLTPGFAVPGPTAKGAQDESARDRKRNRKRREPATAPRRTSVQEAWGGDPLRVLSELARRLNVRPLVEALSHVTLNGSKVETTSKKRSPRLRWIRDEGSALCDVVLVSEADGRCFPAHRCLLAARMDFFRMMFAHQWQETCAVAPVSLRLPGDALELILEYVYTDELESARNDPGNAELLCNVLGAAEVYQCRRLKQMCEELLAARLTLRNVADVLDLAHFYQAAQLLLSCHDFMHINVAALLESRLLDGVDEEQMEAFTRYYKAATQQLRNRRRLAVDSQQPTQEHLELVERLLEAPAAEEEEEGGAGAGPVLAPAQKRRRRRALPLNLRSISLSSEDGAEPAIVSPPAPPQPEETWELKAEEFPEAEEKAEATESKTVQQRIRFKKLSQKERKRLQLRAQEEAEEQRRQQEEAPRTPVCPWATRTPDTPTSPGSAVISLRDVMRSQEAQSPAPPPPPSAPRTPRGGGGVPGAKPWGEAASPSKSSPAAPLASFAAIVREQESSDSSAQRRASRPLKLIQIEERAVQELRTAAGAGALAGELNVRVEVVRTDAAAPVWRTKV